jgi:hypothetical protein
LPLGVVDPVSDRVHKSPDIGFAGGNVALCARAGAELFKGFDDPAALTAALVQFQRSEPTLEFADIDNKDSVLAEFFEEALCLALLSRAER